MAGSKRRRTQTVVAEASQQADSQHRTLSNELEQGDQEVAPVKKAVKKKGKSKVLEPSVDIDNPDLRSKASGILQKLMTMYPDPPIPLNHSSTFQLLVAVTLSAQTTDLKVNEATPALFKDYPDAAALSQAEVSHVTQLIRFLGLAPTKAKNIVAMAKILMEKFGGEVPCDWEALESLPGVGHKTASVVMAQAFGKDAFPVDTHIHRLAQRWGLTNGDSVEQTEADLKALFPMETWKDVHLQIIYFGREHCPAVGHDPTGCPICGWAAVAPYNRPGTSPARPGQKPPSHVDIPRAKLSPTKLNFTSSPQEVHAASPSAAGRKGPRANLDLAMTQTTAMDGELDEKQNHTRITASENSRRGGRPRTNTDSTSHVVATTARAAVFDAAAVSGAAASHADRAEISAITRSRDPKDTTASGKVDMETFQPFRAADEGTFAAAARMHIKPEADVLQEATGKVKLEGVDKMGIDAHVAGAATAPVIELTATATCAVAEATATAGVATAAVALEFTQGEEQNMIEVITARTSDALNDSAVLQQEHRGDDLVLHAAFKSSNKQERSKKAAKGKQSVQCADDVAKRVSVSGDRHGSVEPDGHAVGTDNGSETATTFAEHTRMLDAVLPACFDEDEQQLLLQEDDPDQNNEKGNTKSDINHFVNPNSFRRQGRSRKRIKQECDDSEDKGPSLDEPLTPPVSLKALISDDDSDAEMYMAEDLQATETVILKRLAIRASALKKQQEQEASARKTKAGAGKASATPETVGKAKDATGGVAADRAPAGEEGDAGRRPARASARKALAIVADALGNKSAAAARQAAVAAADADAAVNVPAAPTNHNDTTEVRRRGRPCTRIKHVDTPADTPHEAAAAAPDGKQVESKPARGRPVGSKTVTAAAAAAANARIKKSPSPDKDMDVDVQQSDVAKTDHVKHVSSRRRATAIATATDTATATAGQPSQEITHATPPTQPRAKRVSHTGRGVATREGKVAVADVATAVQVDQAAVAAAQDSEHTATYDGPSKSTADAEAAADTADTATASGGARQGEAAAPETAGTQPSTDAPAAAAALPTKTTRTGRVVKPSALLIAASEPVVSRSRKRLASQAGHTDAPNVQGVVGNAFFHDEQHAHKDIDKTDVDMADDVSHPTSRISEGADLNEGIAAGVSQKANQGRPAKKAKPAPTQQQQHVTIESAGVAGKQGRAANTKDTDMAHHDVTVDADASAKKLKPVAGAKRPPVASKVKRAASQEIQSQELGSEQRLSASQAGIPDAPAVVKVPSKAAVQKVVKVEKSGVVRAVKAEKPAAVPAPEPTRRSGRIHARHASDPQEQEQAQGHNDQHAHDDMANASGAMLVDSEEQQACAAKAEDVQALAGSRDASQHKTRCDANDKAHIRLTDESAVFTLMSIQKRESAGHGAPKDQILIKGNALPSDLEARASLQAATTDEYDVVRTEETDATDVHGHADTHAATSAPAATAAAAVADESHTNITPALRKRSRKSTIIRRSDC